MAQCLGFDRSALPQSTGILPFLAFRVGVCARISARPSLRKQTLMNEAIKQALETEHLIDISTTGRKTGQPRRIEIWFHYVYEKVYITGAPGARSWYANMLANPDVTFHLKKSVRIDIPGRAIPIREMDERRRILERMSEVEKWPDSMNLEDRILHAPLIEIQLTI